MWGFPKKLNNIENKIFVVFNKYINSVVMGRKNDCESWEKGRTKKGNKSKEHFNMFVKYSSKHVRIQHNIQKEVVQEKT